LSTAFASSFFASRAAPQLRKDLPSPALDVIIVGAGAAGVGTALMLTTTFGLDASRVLLIERGEAVGDTFRRWPEEMRFISPSFNQQGWTASFDLNSIAYGTSPAYSLHAEHPSGDEYADYLNALARDAKLCVRTQTEVVSVQAEGVKGGPPLFSVGLSRAEPGSRRTGPTGATETLAARYVVWAAGEFQYPAEAESAGAVVGAELCMHNSRVPSWAGLPGDDFVVIGGYVVSARPLSPTPDRSHNSFSTSQRSTSSDLPWLSTSLPCETAQRLHSHTLHLVPLH
jgi:putative flavoprotein involved in K+ transport